VGDLPIHELDVKKYVEKMRSHLLRGTGTDQRMVSLKMHSTANEIIS